MITIQRSPNLLDIAVLGEFTLADFKQIEDQALSQLNTSKLTTSDSVSLLFDLRDMIDYTIDVALEEIKFFSGAHPAQFKKIAVVTNDQWITWQAWLSRLFVHADIRPFTAYEDAKAWVHSDS
ncbi:MAG: STAS/SEC14 domain-containing protein [Candidatus Nitrotoga sp.]